MISSKNNIVVKIENTKKDDYAILNPVSGSFDLMGKKEFMLLQELDKGKCPVDNEFSGYLLERGYAFKNQDDQEKAVGRAYEEFTAEAASSQVQLILVPTYGCNLACKYCFQHGVESKFNLITEEAVDAFFKYAETNFSAQPVKPFITLFGGEPLINSRAQKKIIEYIVEKCVQGGYELSAVTNGYDFKEYAGILSKARIKEIQFTLDGSKDIHDKRRATANKKGTFDRIIDGIEAAVKYGMPVNLRSVFDTENIEDAVNLAEYIDKKGWLDLSQELFKTQIGRNYELFECYAKPQHLLSQVELWGRFVSLSRKYPVLAKYHRPDFKGIRHIADTGEMYMASFDTCPACKTEWVFDLYGNIYGCTASCGRKEYLLGAFWPEVKLDIKAIDTWKLRNTRNIKECNECKYDVICGGGCGVVAANKNGGNINAPDCRPVGQLIELGVNYYIDEIKKLAVDGETEDESCSQTGCCENGCHTGDKTAKSEGCIICGKELSYSATALKETCFLCGQQFESYARCQEGHYVCDSCHSIDFLDKAEKYLIGSSEKDPVILAGSLFDFAELNIHGPEYHSIVPAVLITAIQNIREYKDAATISEAIRRGRDTNGGSCGYHGACAAGIGAGIAASIIEGATPMSGEERGRANKATALALLEISKYNAPRCCRREAITAIESFINSTDYFRELKKTGYKCRQYKKNKECITKRCPYFPKKND